MVTIDEGTSEGWIEDFRRDEMRSFTEGAASLSVKELLAVVMK